MQPLVPPGRPHQLDTVSARIAGGRQALIDGGFRREDAALDAEVLAGDVLGWDRARLLADGREPASADFSSRYASAIGRRLKREPVAMITAGGCVAWLVYRYLGLKFVSRSWFNLEATWACSLVLVGALSLAISLASRY